MNKLVSHLLKLPIDIGQAEKKHISAGKRIAFSFIPSGKGKTALDIGCRDGFWSDMLKKKGYIVRSLDIEPHYKDALVHDVEKGLPFEKNSVDLVWCTEVLEHLHNPSLLIREIDRIGKSGGVAILTTPNSAWWLYPVVGIWGWTPKKLQNIDHKQFFDYEGLARIAKGYDVSGYFPYAFFFFKIKSLIWLLSPTFILTKKFK